MGTISFCLAVGASSLSGGCLDRDTARFANPLGHKGEVRSLGLNSQPEARGPRRL